MQRNCECTLFLGPGAGRLDITTDKVVCLGASKMKSCIVRADKVVINSVPLCEEFGKIGTSASA